MIGDLAVSIEFVVTSDASTVINLANHAYFNLDRQKSQVDTHQLRLVADSYTPVDETGIPTGDVAAVENTDFDFREMAPVQDKLFDHNFVPEGAAGKLRPPA